MRLSKRILTWISICLCLVATLHTGGSRTSHAYLQVYANVQVTELLEETAAYVKKTVKTPVCGSVGGEWAVFALARADKCEPNYGKAYLKQLAKTLSKQQGILQKNTDYARVVICLNSLGVDSRKLGDYDLVAPLLKKKQVMKQGILSVAYTLLALEGYADMTGEAVMTVSYREALLTCILEHEFANGGFALAGAQPDIDVTAMVLSMLSRYQDAPADICHAELGENIRQTIVRGLTLLSAAQKEDGSYDTCESTAQVLLMLSCLDEKPDGENFTKKNGNVIDGLNIYRLKNGAYCHERGGKENLMSAEQALYALAATVRAKNGKEPLFVFTDVNKNAHYQSYIEEKLADLDEKATEEKTTEEKPTEEKTTEEKSTEEKTTEEKSTEEKKKDKKHTKEQTTEEKITEEKSTEEKTTEEKYTGNKEDNAEKTAEEEEQADTEADKPASETPARTVLLEMLALSYQLAERFTCTGFFTPFGMTETLVCLQDEEEPAIETAENAAADTANAAMQETTAPEAAETQEQTEENTEQPTEKNKTEESEEQNENKREYTCSIYIECKTLLDNMDLLKKSKRKLVPKSGYLLSKTEVSFEDGDTVFDVLKKVTGKHKISFEYVKTPAYNSVYIEGIGNLYEFDAGELSGWKYSVNGKYPSYGCSRYVLQDGDKIAIRYTCDLGEDLK